MAEAVAATGPALRRGHRGRPRRPGPTAGRRRSPPPSRRSGGASRAARVEVLIPDCKGDERRAGTHLRRPARRAEPQHRDRRPAAAGGAALGVLRPLARRAGPGQGGGPHHQELDHRGHGRDRRGGRPDAGRPAGGRAPTSSPSASTCGPRPTTCRSPAGCRPSSSRPGREAGAALGIPHVEASPLTRSSYHARQAEAAATTTRRPRPVIDAARAVRQSTPSVELASATLAPMGKTLPALDATLTRFIERQHLFFVATAPDETDGHVNLSPKGYDTFRVLGPDRVAYLDLTGSGAETIAHLRQNGRITLLFCAFEGKPQLVRLYGRGEVLVAATRASPSWSPGSRPQRGLRSVIVVHLERVATSCGYSVPRFSYVEERPTLDEWCERRSPAQLDAYRAEHNTFSIDGLPALDGTPAGLTSRAVQSPTDYAGRLDRVRGAMAEAGVDVVLASVGGDLPWLIGYEAMNLPRLTMLVLPRDGQPTLFIPNLEVPRVVRRGRRLHHPGLGGDRGPHRPGGRRDQRRRLHRRGRPDVGPQRDRPVQPAPRPAPLLPGHRGGRAPAPGQGAGRDRRAAHGGRGRRPGGGPAPRRRDPARRAHRGRGLRRHLPAAPRRGPRPRELRHRRRRRERRLAPPRGRAAGHRPGRGRAVRLRRRLLAVGGGAGLLLRHHPLRVDRRAAGRVRRAVRRAVGGAVGGGDGGDGGHAGRGRRPHRPAHHRRRRLRGVLHPPHRPRHRPRRPRGPLHRRGQRRPARPGPRLLHRARHLHPGPLGRPPGGHRGRHRRRARSAQPGRARPRRRSTPDRPGRARPGPARSRTPRPRSPRPRHTPRSLGR